MAQVNAVVGDLAGNRDRILRHIEKARNLGVELLIFPELALTGYPPEDLLLKPDFVAAAESALRDLIPASEGLTVIVGCVRAADDLFNTAAVLHHGALAGYQDKQYLPNYGVFDENRYFSSGRQNRVFRAHGTTFGLSICEDIWYPAGPAEAQAGEGGAELLINLSASPYSMGKGAVRERLLAARAMDSTAYLAYCNLVGGQDELVFDGQSLIFGPHGELVARGLQFEEDVVVADLDFQHVFRARLADPRRRKSERPQPARVEEVALVELSSRVGSAGPARITPALEPVAEVYQALVLGVRDYVRKNRFSRVVLGLSGGVDSALTAVIAADALGAENVTGVAMPTRYSSAHSLDDAEALARQVGLFLLRLPIDPTFQSFLDALAPVFGNRAPDLTEENLQPRIRGTMLMALSNKFGWLVLTTGNKSETSVGYSTLYGDTAGGFAVIKDVPKTLVYELCRYRNELAGTDLIPARTLQKPPSAELRPDQRDTDSLPDYGTLDPILKQYVEENRSVVEVVRDGYDEATVRQVVRLVDRNEYKRRQSPPGVKITARAFGKDWRLPITQQYSG
jgi:NAD+ synthase (glutamine-hydrolysing)